MKYISILSLMMLFVTVSCESLIEPKVYSILTDANAFQSKDDAIAAVNAAYSRLKQPSGSNDSWMYYAGFQVTITDLTTDAGHAKSGGDVELFFSQVANFADRFLGADVERQVAFVDQLKFGLIGLATLVACLRLPAFLCEVNEGLKEERS